VLEYRHFLAPHDARLCILLDGNPGPALINYTEWVFLSSGLRVPFARWRNSRWATGGFERVGKLRSEE